LRLPRGTHQTGTERLRADPRDGLYAVDLGKLSGRQYRAVEHALRGPVVTLTRPQAKAKVPPAHHHETRRHGGVQLGFILPGILLILLVAAGIAVRSRSPKPDAGE
jgi:hypothetical protein